MRAVVAEETKVGLLLFDEPSASLDPTAEHGTRFLPLSMRVRMVLTAGTCRSVCAAAGAAREQDDGVFVAPFREPHETCGSDSVSAFIARRMYLDVRSHIAAADTWRTLAFRKLAPMKNC